MIFFSLEMLAWENKTESGEGETNPPVTEQDCEHNILLNDTQKELELCNTFYIAACHLVGNS